LSFLIDTNVLSELRKGSRCDRNVADWFGGIAEADIFLSVLTIGELRRGVDLIRRRDAKSASHLNDWLRGITDIHQDRILPVDRAIAEEWGRMCVARPLPVIDGLLAATAKVHGLCLVTRNTRDIAGTGVDHLDPFVSKG